MENVLTLIATWVALGLELMVVLVVMIGGAEALLYTVLRLLNRAKTPVTRRAIWLRFAGWILLALEFALGADIVRTAVAPNWDDIGKLACIAAIRTGLSFFLERDMDELSASEQHSASG